MIKPACPAILGKLWAALTDLLYPRKCPFCGRVLEREDPDLCPRCQGTLPWTKADDLRVLENCDGCLAPLWYREGARDAVHRYKFRGGQNHAGLLGSLMARCVQERWEEPLDTVTWVPLSQKHLRQRGYDQARLLAEQAASRLGLPAVCLLEKHRNTKAQSTLERVEDRRANIAGAYRLRAEATALCMGKRILLVDDVITSGSTMAQCAGLLKKGGASSVTALGLAWARRG